MVLLLILMTSVIVVAEETNSGVETQDICNYIKEKVVIGGEIPSYVPYKNERFNIYTLDKKPVGSIVSEKGVLKDISCETISDPSYNLYLKDLTTIKNVFDSEKPLKAFNKEKSEGNIDIEGQTVSKSLKAGFTNILLRVAGWFN